MLMCNTIPDKNGIWRKGGEVFMDEKDWEWLNEASQTAVSMDEELKVQCKMVDALLDLHERMKEVQMIQLNLLGRVSHIEGYQKQRYGMASFQSYHERLEHLEKRVDRITLFLEELKRLNK